MGFSLGTWSDSVIHYHGTPITPRSVLHELAGSCFCVPFSDPRDVQVCHEIGQSVMIDNGAFTFWKRNKIQDTPRSWSSYYEWVRPWLDFHTTWAVIPDVIDGSESENDALIQEWCSRVGKMGFSASPVWHIHESLSRLDYLIAGWPRVCFGSSGRFAKIGTTEWDNRMNEVFNHICRSASTPAWIHMLRGMALAGSDYPFASVDSTNVAQNHWRKNNALEIVRKWDARQCPSGWREKETVEELQF